MYKVIVAITTYNLEKYIAEALDSVLNQKTDFKFLIRVADDCSTDRTPEILKEYVRKYPDLIQVVYSKNNLGSLANSNRLFDHIECEYFSFLDGDDYWVDENRLQKQVDFMDSHPDYSMVTGNTQYLRDGVLSDYLIDDKYLNNTFTYDDFLKSRMPFFHTSAILVRNTIFINGLPDIYKSVLGTFEECALRGEDSRRYIHMRKGPVYIMEDLFSVYRIHDMGTWQGKSYVRQILEGAIQYNFFNKYFDDKPSKVFFRNRFNTLYAKILMGLFRLNNNSDKYKYSRKDVELLSSLLLDMSQNSSDNNRESQRFNKVDSYMEKLISKFFKN